jgi:hypothetical protein
MLKLIVALILLCPSYAWAEERASAPIATVPTGEDRIVSLEKGQPAPYEGHLFDTDTALRWANWLEQYKYRLELDVDTEQAKCKIELDYQTDLIDIERVRTSTIEADLRARLQTSEKRNIKLSNEIMNRSFFSSMEFGLLLGIVVTSGAAVAVAVVAN